MREFHSEIIKEEIENGLAQVDETLVIETFSCQFDSVSRKLQVFFTARNDSGETVDINLDY